MHSALHWSFGLGLKLLSSALQFSVVTVLEHHVVQCLWVQPAVERQAEDA